MNNDKKEEKALKDVLILGAGGMAGHVVSTYLKETGRYSVKDVCHSIILDEKSIKMDVITEKEELIHLIETTTPDILINCMAILPIRKAEENPDMAIYVNAYLPRLLERVLASRKTRIIHLSTDCVFSGKRGNYTSSDPSDAVDAYGRTKALGEIKNSKDLTIRTSIIGPELKENGTSLFHWFMSQKGEIKGYRKVFWTGLTTVELAKVIDWAIEADIRGLKQIVPPQKISKYELLLKIREVFKKEEVTILPYDELVCDRSLIPDAIPGMPPVPDYDEMIKEMHRWIIKHAGVFKNYQKYIP